MRSMQLHLDKLFQRTGDGCYTRESRTAIISKWEEFPNGIITNQEPWSLCRRALVGRCKTYQERSGNSNCVRRDALPDFSRTFFELQHRVYYQDQVGIKSSLDADLTAALI